MKRIEYILLLFFLISVSAGIYSSCTSMDDYLKYTDGKEIVYTGKVDSVIFRSGRERVVFSGLLISDPKINKVSIFWNNKTDSMIMNIDRQPGIDTLQASIPLSEGTYNFELYTADTNGNSSVPAYATGKSYGTRYESGLYDRPVKDVVQKEGYVLIEWYNSDPTSFVRLDYSDENDIPHFRYVYAESDTTILSNCKEASRIKMQTYYLPDAYAIDTFKVAAEKYINADADFTTRYLKNSGAEGAGIDGTVIEGNYGYPTDWFVSDEVKVDNSRYGWINTNVRRERALNFEAISNRDIENGKVYQTFVLDSPGKYSLSYTCLKGTPTVGNRSRTDVYYVAYKGKTLPDITDIETDRNVLGYSRVEEGIPVKGENKGHFSFQIDEATEITYGFVMNIRNSGSYQVNELKLSYDAVF